MPKTPMTQSQKRFQDSLGSLFLNPADHKSKKGLLFLKSSSDIGVIRNGGRNGARLAPQSFLSVFKKMNHHPSLKCHSFAEVEVSSEESEKLNFEQSQNQEADLIKKSFEQYSGFWKCHLGGGHDHVYPLLVSLSHYKKIVVINIDAHADTRDDDECHSGNPFRKFAEKYQNEFHLFQVGLHPFANSQSTLAPLKNGSMAVLWKEEMSSDLKWDSFFKNIKDVVDENTALIFSLDADALDGASAPGVSAVNGRGIEPEELEKCWKKYQSLCPHAPIIGIYELNPVYDDLSMLTVRRLTSFLYQALI